MAENAALHLVPLLPGIEGLVAHFAGRTGGVSSAPFASLNLGFSTGDDPAAVVENRRRLATALEAPLERWVVTGQVHGARVVRAAAADAGDGAVSPSQVLGAADGVFLPEPGVFALALSADCPLVVVADPLARRVGVAHAGWRGTAAGVVGALVDRFEAEGSAPGDLRAALSPGIGPECYPVGEEVFAALAALPGARAARHERQLDLRRIHREILLARGLGGAAIAARADCSACDAGRYFSHRRDAGRTGRNGALVGWRQGLAVR